jgi:exopolysaccharide biosynthesis polyprenyl glycosylphosphotransferase
MSNLTSPLQRQDSRSLMRDLRSSSQPAFSRSFLAQNIRGSYLILLDAFALIFARYLSEALSSPWNPVWSFKTNPSVIFLLVGINISILLSNGLYKSGRSRRNYPAIFKSVSLSSLLLLLIAFLYLPNELISRSTFGLFWLSSFLFVSLGRYFSNHLINKINDMGYLLHPIFVITDADNESRIINLVKTCPHYKLKGLDNSQALAPDRINSTIRRLQSLKVSELYIHADSLEDPMHVYWKFQHAGIAIYLLPEDLTPIFREVELSYINNVPCFKMNVPSISGVNFWLKRSLDFVFSLVLLVLLSPVYMLLSVLIYLDDPGAIFYRQTRIGLHGKPFKVWKFRTMVSNADQLQKELESQNENRDGILFKIKDDPRITRLGKFLRNYSLDELPQIFNIFLGEMSLIGPRPLPIRDVEKFESHHHVRHEVLPGITGLWQVSGRSDINNFDDVLRLDVQYIERWSIWLDLKILLKTIAVIFAKSGAY